MKNSEKESNKACHKVCEWKKNHNDRNRSISSKDSEERYMGM